MNYVGVCTDGAPEMLGFKSGLITRLNEKSLDTGRTYCITYSEVKYFITLLAAIKNIIMKLVKFIITIMSISDYFLS